MPMGDMQKTPWFILISLIGRQENGEKTFFTLNALLHWQHD